MVFSSLEFLFLYLPLTLAAYFVVPAKYLGARNIVLFILSLAFYGWGEPAYVFLMLFTIAVDYAAGMLIERYKGRDNNAAAKRVLIYAVIINLALLGFFKYFGFIVSNLAKIPLLSWIEAPEIRLPIGISFYTFQALSYVVDVYRRDTSAQKNFITFGTYVTLFPQLIAGPIVRYRDVEAMLGCRKIAAGGFYDGIRRFAVGLSKKVILANGACMIWDEMSALPMEGRSAVGGWIGLIFYTFYIYFDFSAYSDMAIGMGKMLGFDFLENFNYPYISKSITEFWRRWHISLSTWFLEYVYIPLGGNRRGGLIRLRNLFAVWLLTGLWHGADWNFVIWGLYYFVLLVIEKQFTGKWLARVNGAVSTAITLFFVSIGWLIFASPDMAEGAQYLISMFGGGAGFITAADLYTLSVSLFFGIILAVGATPLPSRLYRKLQEKYPQATGWASVILSGAAIIVSTAYLVNSSYNPFLYLRF